jgi:hypothetical protein
MGPLSELGLWLPTRLSDLRPQRPRGSLTVCPVLPAAKSVTDSGKTELASISLYRDGVL